MKLVRWGAAGAEKPGLVDTHGAVRDLSGVFFDIDAAVLSPEGLARLTEVNPDDLPLAAPGDPLEVLAVHEALDRLSVKSPRKAEVVKLRYFLGCTMAETAQIEGVIPPPDGDGGGAGVAGVEIGGGVGLAAQEKNAYL